MKYKFCENIRIRKCDDLIFFVNISNNSIYSIKYPAYEYLCSKLDFDINASNTDFGKFINNLQKNNIIEVIQ